MPLLRTPFFLILLFYSILAFEISSRSVALPQKTPIQLNFQGKGFQQLQQVATQTLPGTDGITTTFIVNDTWALFTAHSQIFRTSLSNLTSRSFSSDAEDSEFGETSSLNISPYGRVFFGFQSPLSSSIFYYATNISYLIQVDISSLNVLHVYKLNHDIPENWMGGYALTDPAYGPISLFLTGKYAVVQYAFPSMTKIGTFKLRDTAVPWCGMVDRKTAYFGATTEDDGQIYRLDLDRGYMDYITLERVTSPFALIPNGNPTRLYKQKQTHPKNELIKYNNNNNNNTDKWRDRDSFAVISNWYLLRVDSKHFHVQYETVTQAPNCQLTELICWRDNVAFTLCGNQWLQWTLSDERPYFTIAATLQVPVDIPVPYHSCAVAADQNFVLLAAAAGGSNTVFKAYF
jgi:hypothetical protein